MSEEKKEQPQGDGPVPETAPKRSRKDIYPFAIGIAIVILLVLVVMGFLSSQKLHKEVVVLERQVEALKENGRKTDGRLQALTDELAVRALQQRRSRIRRALRALDDLKPVVAANPALAVKLRGLKKELQREHKKLGQEIGSGHPAAAFSRPCLSGHPCPPGPCPCPQAAAAGKTRPAAPGHLECANGVCRLVPEKPAADKAYMVALPEGQPEPAHHPVPAVAKPEPVVSQAESSASPAQPETWWTRFINLRIFGGN